MSQVAVQEQTVPRAPKNKKPNWQRLGFMGYAALLIVTFLSIFPFYWMFIVASNGTDEISKIPPTLLPGPRFFTVISNVYEALPQFNQALLNTVYVGTVVALAQVFFSAIAGFAFAKLNFKGQKFMVLFVILTMMLPSQLGIIPLFIMISQLGLMDSLGALIIPALVTAFGV